MADPAPVSRQPPERRGPSLEVWKILAEDQELHSLFAGLVDGGAPGNVEVRICGTKPANPTVVAHIASLLRAPAPTQTTFVRVPGYPAQLGLAVDEYAQLRRYAKEASGSEVTIRVHRCTQLAHSNLHRPVFDLELEGLPENWQSVRLGAPDTRLPDRLWKRTTRSSRRGHYYPVSPRARMTRPEGSGRGLQQPAEAPDHTGDPAMAKAESAVVDADEEDEDIY